MRRIGLTLAVGLAGLAAAGAAADEASSEIDLEPRATPWSDRVPSRVFLGPTAFLPEPGDWSFVTLDAGYGEFQYGATPEIAVHFGAALPAMNIGAVGGADFSLSLGREVRWGFGVLAGGFATYPELYAAGPLFGASTSLTVGDPDLFFNVGLMAYGTVELSGEPRPVVALAPHLGGLARVSPRVALVGELLVPALFVADDEPWLPFGKLWVLAYGVRIGGESVWGQFVMLMPVMEGIQVLLQFAPLGLPAFSLGVDW